MKKTLILVRHAAAEDQKFMVQDFERTLVEKGRADALIMGNWMSGQDIKPDHFVSSPAARAYETAEIIGGQLQFGASDIVKADGLYEGGYMGYLQTVNAIPADCNMAAVFGHNPDITFFAEFLTGKELEFMSKCSIVMIRFDKLEWAEISGITGELVLYMSPKKLREAN